MNNAVYGKTIKNVRNRRNVKIINGLEEKMLKKLIVKPNLKSTYIFKDSNMVMVTIKTLRV